MLCQRYELQLTLLIAVLAIGAAQSVTANAGTNLPGCLVGVNLAGRDLQVIRATDLETCRQACDTSDKECLFAVFNVAGDCYLKNIDYTTDGADALDASVVQTCFRRRADAAPEEACVAAWDIRGTNLAATDTDGRESCRQLCEAMPGCHFSVRTTWGRCILRGAPFTGDAGQTGHGPSNDQLCWRRTPMPADAAADSSAAAQAAQRGAASGCLPGVNLAGLDVGPAWWTASREACRTACDVAPGCVFSVRNKDGACFLKKDPFSGGAGSNEVDPWTVDQACWKRQAAAASADAACVRAVDIAGTDLATIQTASSDECRQACDGNESCVFSVRLLDGACILRASPFTGTNGVSSVSLAVDQLCWASPRKRGLAGCLPGVNYDGVDLRVLSGVDLDTCRRACETLEQRCTFVVYNNAGDCFLKSRDALANGADSLDASVQQMCFRIWSYSPAVDEGCISWPTIHGTDLAGIPDLDREGCRKKCDVTPGCYFSIHYAAGNAWCTLRGDPFTGGYWGQDVYVRGIDQLCWRRGPMPTAAAAKLRVQLRQ
ncbi:hypothetical protein GPECTOR_64g91 [Gonium pectorale]|uniref:Apple domain-containing protein n=1 Tax=Gonium pectorale TaxID=33097 RepID=A0A150G4C6_GONPE|nr:hypothetical protein GPECTOR_64g91 [Gonium pectorale]|eukprot:KXZ44671.1 hypothetical protein GPECTOR_64g91 [Gonium pectorale]